MALTDELIFALADPFGAFEYGDAQGDKRKDFARAIEYAACAARDQRIAELEQRNSDLYQDVQRFKEHALNEKDARLALEQELEAVCKDAERKHDALKDAGLFLHHAWCDVQMNEYSFERLSRTMEIVDAAIDAAKERT